jgi:hypothetical protein
MSSLRRFVADGHRPAGEVTGDGHDPLRALDLDDQRFRRRAGPDRWEAERSTCVGPRLEILGDVDAGAGQGTSPGPSTNPVRGTIPLVWTWSG